MSAGVIMYLVVTAALGAVAMLKTSHWLRRLLKRQKAVLSSRGKMQAIPTDSPLRNPAMTAKERGLESIESQFTVTRRVLLPAIFVTTAGALSLPFWSKIPGAVLSVVVAGAAVLLGIVARPSLENALAGLTVSMSNLFNIGDTVLFDEQYGTIEDITTTHTTIKLWDWRRYVVPNSQMLSSKLINYSLHDRYRWTHVEFSVSYDADLEAVREVALAAPVDSAYFAPHESPAFWIMDLRPEGVRIWVAAWADSPSDSWMLANHMRTEIIRGFRAHGIKAHAFHHALGTPAPETALEDDAARGHLSLAPEDASSAPSSGQGAS